MMARKSKNKVHTMHRSSRRKQSVQGFYTPFEHLDQDLARHSPTKSRPPAPDRSAPSEGNPSGRSSSEEADEAFFRKAMVGVVPLERSRRERVPPERPAKSPPRFLEREELETYAQLIDLVKGDSPFELSFSDEYVDGAVVGLSPEILKKLRSGDFSYQDHVDLHGMKRDEAREAVIQFIYESFALRHRCVLIVSGRGLNSRDKEPILKQGLVRWLTRAPLKHLVLAFASARSYDGGAGAFYVLLRRNKTKGRLITPAP